MAKKELIVDGISYALSYEILNQHNKHCIVFLHGWGANKELMRKAFGQELSQFRHIYIDLPGFGNSSIYKPLTTAVYARIIEHFLESLHVEDYIVLGHSFGGKVATLLPAISVVLLSSAGIVEAKPLKVRLKIWLFKLFKSCVPKAWYKFFASSDVAGMSQVMYETLKNVVDEDFTDFFAAIGVKTLIFWGKEDTAVSLDSGKTIAGLIENSEFYPLDGDHFFFLGHTKYIAQIIEKRLG